MRLRPCGGQIAAVTTALAAAAALLPFASLGQADELQTIPVATPAEEATTVLEPVIVTGTRIPRTDYETASPVFVFTADDIADTGHTNIGELLDEVPMAGSAMNRTFNNGGNGQTEIELRSLGSNRLLILVDGHRWIGGSDAFNTRAVDLTNIPVSIIERVEVLKDGASPIYGSDAIAGVVNIITRRFWTGAEAGSHWQAYEDGKNFTQSHGLTYGRVAGWGSLFLDLSFLKQNAMSAAARDMTRWPKYGTGVTRGSHFTPRSHPIFIAEPQVATALNATSPGSCRDAITGTGQTVAVCNVILRDGAATTAGETLADAAAEFRPFDPIADPYNYAPLNHLLVPLERPVVFAQLSRRFLDTLLVNVQATYAYIETDLQLAESVFLFGDQLFGARRSDTYVDRTHVFNPFGQDIGRHEGQGTDGDVLGGGIGSGIVARRFVELGPRLIERRNHSGALRSAVSGTEEFLDRRWYFEIGGAYRDNRRRELGRNDLRVDRLKLALGPAANCDADPQCVPVNLFGAPGTDGAMTPAMLDYVRLDTESGLRSYAGELNATASTEFEAALPEPVGIAFGAEFREEGFRESLDAALRQGLGNTQAQRDETAGHYGVVEAYAELNVPLLRGLSGARALDLSLAGRYTDYSIYAPATTRKVGVRYKPLADLLLRATWSEAYRAPSVTELYLGTVESGSLFLRDPCIGPPSAEVEQHCAEEGAPGTRLALSDGSTLASVSGNPRLRPETAEGVTAGLVVSPAFLPDFSASLDYFRFVLDDYIDFLTPDLVLSSCYERPPGAPRPATCDLARRDRFGNLQSITLTTANLDQVRTDGFDLGFEHFFTLGEGLLAFVEWPGMLRWRFDSQYLRAFESFLVAGRGAQTTNPTQTGASALAQAGEAIGDRIYPRFKAAASLSWASDAWEMTWRTRYIRGTTERCDDTLLFGAPVALRNLGVCSNPDPDLSDGRDDSTNRLADVFYHDVQVTRALALPSMDLTFGIWNLFAQDPPASYSNATTSYPSTEYRPPDSRAPYARVRMRF